MMPARGDIAQRELIEAIMNAKVPHLENGVPQESGCTVRNCLRVIDYRMGNEDPYVKMLAVAGIARIRFSREIHLLLSPKKLEKGILRDECRREGTTKEEIRMILLGVPDAVDGVKRNVGGAIFTGVSIPILYVRKIIKKY